MGRTTRDPAITSRIMSRIRSKDTEPELRLAKEFRRAVIRFRRHPKLPGTPDFVIVEKNIVVFCDGDFWHGHNWRLRRLKSRAQEFSLDKRKYWLMKIKSNINRDNRNNKDLRKLGYKVLRYCESDIKKNAKKVIGHIKKELAIH